MIRDYGKLQSFGGSGAREILSAPVRIEEKVDGSQFSFMRVGSELLFRSRNVEVNPLDPGLFGAGVKALQEIAHVIPELITFRGEYLAKPKHNHLAYDRVPARHVILFDAFSEHVGGTGCITRELLEVYAAEMGLEVVPLLGWGVYAREQLQELLQTKSVLGGQIVEGVVLKSDKLRDHYNEHHPLRVKLVRPSFQEDQRKEWKANNPKQADILDQLVDRYKTIPRWRKAVQHLRDQNLLANAPADIPFLIREVQKDIEEECKADIQEALWKWFWKKAQREVTKGLAEWYKEELANG